ncbi:MAG: hypothetical protein OMM_01784 [Candidatus Magnetoglobus multicellularis str. Araruama]|uniref:Uncharacterized protein n=1 Tax=Candidatus Magnetoglobus multicellularis str. Araruama TaxID=890399 RepID=A0A1V1PC22_9BACT|nr:MAG: hypothetical protein OMM_01784 [Candidatus Magnetoglobus multicellularis str. Araruama]
MFFALYILGARFKTIALIVELPEESGKTTINRVMNDGVSAFNDRRQSIKNDVKQRQPSTQSQVCQAYVTSEDDYCIIIFGDINHQLKIPLNNRVYLKSVLLSLLQANILTASTVSSVLGITPAHCRNLADRLLNEDLTEVLVDKRKGQQNDFRVNESVKADLIQNFSARAVTGHSVSSNKLADLINNKNNTNISPRTIRWHMNKLGLMNIKKLFLS